MKKNAKNRVISRIENSVRRVELKHEPIDSPFLYCVTEYSKRIRTTVVNKYFNNLESAENYMFENYVYLIIPSDRLINEGFHVFLY